MATIDLSYFTRSLQIAQLSQPEVADTVESYIEELSQEFLKKLLGDVLYVEFIEGLTVEPVDAKWTQLNEWLINSDLKKSPIANYVYYWLLFDSVTENTGIGIVAMQGENSTRVSPVDKMVKAWNDMLPLIDVVHKNLIANQSLYPSYAHKRRSSITKKANLFCSQEPVFGAVNSLGI
jgi:hypothetical protein